MLNKVKPNSQMYTWLTHTFNTVKGECLHDCTYCYMKRWGKLNPIRLDKNEFKTDLGKGNHIFVGSSCDMFAKDIPPEWIHETLQYLWRFPFNDYYFQSKDTRSMCSYFNGSKESGILPLRTTVITTIETNRYYPKIMRNSPTPHQRVDGLILAPCPIFVTIEPIMDFDLDEMIHLIRMCQPEMVNIGADSGKNDLPEPSKEKVLSLVSELSTFTHIHNKRNINRLIA